MNSVVIFNILIMKLFKKFDIIKNMKNQSKIQNKEVGGFIFAVLDMVTFGLLPVFSNYFVKTIDPLLFAGLTTLIGSFPFLLKLKLQNQEKDLYSQKFIKSLLGIAMLTTIGSFFYFVGTKYTTGINTGLLTQIEPFYAIVLSAIFLGEVVKRNQIMATLTMVLGAIVLVYKGINQLNIGDIFIVLAPMFFQASHIIAKKIMNKVSDTDAIPAARLLYSGILLSIMAFVTNPLSFWQLFSLQNIVSIIGFAFIFVLAAITSFAKRYNRPDHQPPEQSHKDKHEPPPARILAGAPSRMADGYIRPPCGCPHRSPHTDHGGGDAACDQRPSPGPGRRAERGSRPR